MQSRLHAPASESVNSSLNACLRTNVGVMNQSPVDATGADELLLQSARCARARMSSQIEVKMLILLGADAVAQQIKRSSPTSHG